MAARQVSNLRNLGLTRRALALFVVLAVLALSYASSLRIYLDTERKNAENKQSIEHSTQRINELNAELRRWDDPDHVRAQARERLGWVMPGDTGYRVIGADGRPLGPQLESAPADPQAPNPDAWWDRMWGSLSVADHPPVAPDPATVNKPPITDGTNTPTPKPSPTPKASPTKKTG